jgi:hypothetical protein
MDLLIMQTNAGRYVRIKLREFGNRMLKRALEFKEEKVAGEFIKYALKRFICTHNDLYYGSDQIKDDDVDGGDIKSIKVVNHEGKNQVGEHILSYICNK